MHYHGDIMVSWEAWFTQEFKPFNLTQPRQGAQDNHVAINEIKYEHVVR